MKPFCVADLLKLPFFAHHTLISGQQGLSNPISGVNILEAPDIKRWIKGGEVLLTNLYALEDLEPTFIDDLANKNLSAIIIKTGIFVNSIPEDMIEKAERRNLPIIEIKKDILYRDIAFAITECILDDKIKLLKLFKKMHNCFINLTFNNANTQQIIDVLTEIIGNPILLYDSDFVVLRHTSPEFVHAQIVNKSKVESPYFIRKCFLADEKKLLERDKDASLIKNHDNKYEFDQIVFPIEISSSVIYFLAVCCCEQYLSDSHYIAIENALTAIKLALTRQYGIDEVKKRYHNDLLSDLLNGKINNTDDANEKASIIGLNLAKFYTIISFKLTSPLFEAGADRLKIQEAKYNLLYKIIQQAFSNNLLQVRTDKITMLWPVENEQSKWQEQAMFEMEKIWQKWTKKEKEFPLFIGIGSITSNFLNLPQSLSEAEDTIRVIRKFGLSQPIKHFSNLGMYRFVIHAASIDNIDIFISPAMKKLMEYKKDHENTLLKTLHVYLENGCNLAKTSKIINLHYKSVVYRIEKIKKISEIDFNNADEILQMQMVFKILKFKNLI